MRGRIRAIEKHLGTRDRITGRMAFVILNDAISAAECAEMTDGEYHIKTSEVIGRCDDAALIEFLAIADAEWREGETH